MKTRILLIFICTNFHILANDFEGYDSRYIEKINKTREYVSKNKKCYASVWQLAKNVKGSYFEQFTNNIYCVLDTVKGYGTTKEKRGCFLIGYNIKTNSLRAIVNEEHFEAPYVSKSCGKGGFEDLMAKKDIWYPTGSNKPYTVETFIFGSIIAPRSKIDIHLINAENEQTRKYILEKINSTK